MSAISASREHADTGGFPTIDGQWNSVEQCSCLIHDPIRECVGDFADSECVHDIFDLLPEKALLSAPLAPLGAIFIAHVDSGLCLYLCRTWPDGRSFVCGLLILNLSDGASQQLRPRHINDA